ncbi:MAG: ribose 5-phosphate isomerase B [Bacteroidota bacterium]
MKKIAIGSDHAGFEYKEKIKKILEDNKYEVIDFGCFSGDSVDYPDFAHPVAKEVSKGEALFGIVICGTGNGVNITVNKHMGIRSALCWEPEIAKLARQHNDANIVAIPARFVTLDVATNIVQTFVETLFDGGRHATRVMKIDL